MSRVALITGASRGIGAATAQVLVSQGFRVVVNYRSSAEQADEVVRAATAGGGEAVAIRADVTEADDVAAMVAETERRWGHIDVLVHNALIPFDVTSFADLDWEQLGGKLDRELRAAFLVTAIALTAAGIWVAIALAPRGPRRPRGRQRPESPRKPR